MSGRNRNPHAGHAVLRGTYCYETEADSPVLSVMVIASRLSALAERGYEREFETTGFRLVLAEDDACPTI